MVTERDVENVGIPWKYSCPFAMEEFNRFLLIPDGVESTELCEGFPAEMILRKADELNCDAIIMGNRKLIYESVDLVTILTILPKVA